MSPLLPIVTSVLAQPPAMVNIDVKQLHADLDAKKVPILVDVRTPEEFASGHVPGAKNIPLDQVGARLGELAAYKNGPVYMICQRGGRSASASDLVSKQGYKPINVDGGTAAWIAAGYPIEK